jgi:hypothetical protein
MVCTRPPFVGGGRVYKYESDMDCMQQQQRAHVTLHDAWRLGLALGLARRRLRAAALPPLPPRAWTYLRSGGMVTISVCPRSTRESATRWLLGASRCTRKDAMAWLLTFGATPHARCQ